MPPVPSHPSYEVFEEIGSGEVATVYRAHDITLDRPVAIKELHPDFHTDPESMKHFWEEAQFLAGLDHPNIVRIYSIDRDRRWIIMELMKGSLDQKIKSGPLPAKIVRSVMQQVLKGLQPLHEQNRLHGAIKPANLLINDKGEVKLSDSAGVVAGETVRLPKDKKYLAPELLDAGHGPVGAGVDLYCLGFTALELLTGPSFNLKIVRGEPDASTEWLRLHASPTEELPKAEQLIPGIPPDLDQVLNRLTSKKVVDRYASAEEALQDLEDLPIQLVELPRPMKEKPASSRTARMSSGEWPPMIEDDTLPPPPPQPKRKTRVGSTAKPWSRQWLNEKLENPRVLYPFIAVIALITLFFLFFPFGGEPEKKQIQIESSPPGAAIYVTIEGKERKKKPEASVFLPPGEHRVRLELNGYKTKKIKIKVAMDGPSKFTIPLEEAPVDIPPRVTIESDPPGAMVYLRGTNEPQGNTPLALRLTSGEYPIRLVKSGFEVKLGKFTVKSEPSEQKHSFKLEIMPPVTVDVAVQSYPTGAAIELNGKDQLQETNGNLKLVPGRYQLKLTKKGYKSKEVTFVVEEGTATRLPVYELEKLIVGRPAALLVATRQASASLPTTLYADQEIASLARGLKVCGYKEPDLFVLSQAMGEKEVEKAPIADNIRKAMKDLLKTERSAAIVVLSGQIIRFKGEKERYYCPPGTDLAQKTGLMPLNEIVKALSDSSAPFKLLVIDEGHSPCPPDQKLPEELESADLVSLDFPEDVAVFLGTTGPIRYVHPEERHSLFLHTLTMALEGAADKDSNGEVTPKEMAEYVTAQVPDLSQKHYQSKQLPHFHGKTTAKIALTRPQPILAHYWEARALIDSGDHREALKKLDSVIQESPNLVRAYLSRIVLRFHALDYDGMIGDTKTILKIDPTAATAYDYQGDAWKFLKENEKSLEAYTRALEIDPDYAPTWNSRGLVNLLANPVDPTLAIEDFTKAIKNAPAPNPQYFENRGEAKLRGKKVTEAIEDLTKSIKIKPDARRYHLRGMAYYQNKEPQKAIDDFSEVLKRKKVPQTYNARGLAHAALEEHRSAIDDYTEAIRLNENYVLAYKNRSKSYKRLGMEEKAAEDQAKAQQLESRN